MVAFLVPCLEDEDLDIRTAAVDALRRATWIEVSNMVIGSGIKYLSHPKTSVVKVLKVT